MNFALILFVLTVFTGVLWVADKLVFAKQRRERAARLLADFDARNGPRWHARRRSSSRSGAAWRKARRGSPPGSNTRRVSSR
jgi:signal peptidase I